MDERRRPWPPLLADQTVENRKASDRVGGSLNYEFNLLDHAGIVAKAGGVRQVDKINIAVVASFSAAHENGQFQ